VDGRVGVALIAIEMLDTWDKWGAKKR